MLARHAFLPALLIITILSSVAPTISRGQTGARETDCRDSALTLDVEIQSNCAGRAIAGLQHRGIELVGVTSHQEHSRTLTHVFVGRFRSVEAAGRYGDSLVTRGIIDRFLITTISGCAITRPRWVAQVRSYKTPPRSDDVNQGTGSFVPGSESRVVPAWDSVGNQSAGEPPIAAIGRRRRLILALAPGLDPASIPVSDPVAAALAALTSNRPDNDGGLWIEGDRQGAISRLEWIVGRRDSNAVEVGPDGKVALNDRVLLKLSGADRIKAGAELVVADYIRSNEGLYLLSELMRARHRYCLYVGQRLPTAGIEVPVIGSINLDNNFDRRINPYRKDGFKVPNESPPAGFDSMIGINPAAVWFNVRTKRLVPDGMITFHELAEALAKVDYGLEYLPAGLKPGAHDIAVQRELKLSSQRTDAITTAGSNRVFGTEKSLLEFEAEFHESRGGR